MIQKIDAVKVAGTLGNVLRRLDALLKFGIISDAPIDTQALRAEASSRLVRKRDDEEIYRFLEYLDKSPDCVLVGSETSRTTWPFELLSVIDHRMVPLPYTLKRSGSYPFDSFTPVYDYAPSFSLSVPNEANAFMMTANSGSDKVGRDAQGRLVEVTFRSYGWRYGAELTDNPFEQRVFDFYFLTVPEEAVRFENWCPIAA